MLLFLLFLFCFRSRNLVTSVTTLLYLYFIAFVVASKVLVGVDARFEFLHRNRFLQSTISGAIICTKILLIWIFLCVILRCICNFLYFKVFRLEPRKCLEKIPLYGLFCFDRFCLFFCILSFTIFCVVFFAPQGFNSCSWCTKVLVVFVS